MSDIPSREKILEFIASQSGKVGKREIARAFNIKGSARIPLKALLREMTADGAIEKEARGLRRSGDLPSVAVLRVSGHDEDGGFLATPNQVYEGEFIIQVQERAPRGRVNRRHINVGIGDTILARLVRLHDNVYEARIIRKLTQSTARIIGIVEKGADGLWLAPVNRREHKKFKLASSNISFEIGDLVVGERNKKDVRVIENIGSANAEGAFSRLALAEHDIPDSFSNELLAEAEHMTFNKSDYTDLTHLPFITIDPADARDHDDAVFAQTHETGFDVWIAIADVAAYVTPHNTLDKEARKRGNSVYLPDRCVPMLPEKLSTDLCSLHEGVTRPCLVVKIQIAANGKIERHEFIRGLICSRASLTYTQAQAGFDNQDSQYTEWLQPLWSAYQAMATARNKRAPLDLDLPERRIVLDQQGKMIDIHIPPRLEAHRLIEEMMVAANVCAAKTLEQFSYPFIYRIHEAPAKEKLSTLATYLRSFQLMLFLLQNIHQNLFKGILQLSRKTAHSENISEAVLRAQMQAIYSPNNCGHFGLSLASYTHFTSPIRRYSDVMVHRALIYCLKLGQGAMAEADISQLEEIAEHISTTERRAVLAERAATDRYLAAFMANEVGNEFEARISGISRAGLFVRAGRAGADGIIPMSLLSDERLFPDKEGLTLSARRSGVRYRLGDKIDVTLKEALPIKGGLLFAPINQPKRKGYKKRGQKITQA